MKPILTAMTVALLALAVGVPSADAKVKGGGGGVGKGGGSGVAKGGKNPGKGSNKKGNDTDDYFKKNDANKNGTIESNEYPGSKGDFAKYDKNVDGKLDKGEVTAMLKK